MGQDLPRCHTSFKLLILYICLVNFQRALTQFKAYTKLSGIAIREEYSASE